MSSLAIMSNEVLTMSSKEIAELVQSRHDNVKKSIERLVSRNVIQLPAMREVKDNQLLSANNKYTEYLLNKRDSLVVVAQLSPEFTGAIVDRWQELESKFALPDFTNPIVAARAWADEKEISMLLSDKVKELEPKAKFYDDVAEAVNCIDIGAFGKSIGLSRNATFQTMRDIGVLLKQGNSNVPYQSTMMMLQLN